MSKASRGWRTALLCLLLAGTATPAVPVRAETQTPAAKAPLDTRAEQLVLILAGKQPPETFFDANFLKIIPPDNIKSVFSSLTKEHGQPQKLVSVVRKSETSGTVSLAFEKATIDFDIAIGGQPPHQVMGLMVGQIRVANDNLAAVTAELAALPGRVGYKIERIGSDGTRSEIAGRNIGEQYAIGSTFKLYILAELAAQVKAGTRQWSDVIPLRRRSFTSLASDRIPLDTPVTLQLLATWMITVSDNAATDELLLLLGRDKVEARVRKIGHDNLSRMFPFLTTVEAFLIKSDHENVQAAYAKGSDAEQRALLAQSISAKGMDQIDAGKIGNKPASIDTVEWFASPNDIVKLMDHIRTSDDPVMFKIMAQSVAPAIAKKWKYIGFKGGSEAGVISLSYLAQRQSGEWLVITGSWNNVDEAVDDSKFVSLIQRMVDLEAN